MARGLRQVLRDEMFRQGPVAKYHGATELAVAAEPAQLALALHPAGSRRPAEPDRSTSKSHRKLASYDSLKNEMPFPVDEIYLAQTEQKLRIVFPQVFRLQMMRDNGGELETEEDTWQLYPVFDDSTQSRLKRTCNDIVYETEQARQWGRFPATAIAIAGNGNGDHLVYLMDQVNGTKLGASVYQWVHETGELIFITDDIQTLMMR